MIFHLLIHIIPCNNQRCEVKIFTLFYFPALAIAAWETMQERGTVSLNLTENHKAVQNIKARGAFTVSIADSAHVIEADYFGVTSGNKISDKLGKAGLTASRAEKVDAPVINEYS